jgi:4'-phosphopantetheinyl transferase EntD
VIKLLDSTKFDNRAQSEHLGMNAQRRASDLFFLEGSTSIDVSGVCALLKSMLPAGFCVAAGPLLDGEPLDSERPSHSASQPSRIREFASGRAYARKALAELGIFDVAIPVGANHAPVWPPGVIGSISHVAISFDDSFVAVVVAPTAVAAAVGIDLEVDRGLAHDLWPAVFTDVELSRLLELPIVARGRQARALWCAKEAAAKLIGAPFDPPAIEISQNPKNGSDFSARLTDAAKPADINLTGKIAAFAGLIVAIAIPAGGPPVVRREV